MGNVPRAAMKMVGEIAKSDIQPSIKCEVVAKLLGLWFSEETNPDGDFGKEITQQLLDLVSEGLLEKVRAKAKDRNNSTKAGAESLLEKLKEYLLP